MFKKQIHKRFKKQQNSVGFSLGSLAGVNQDSGSCDARSALEFLPGSDGNEFSPDTNANVDQT